MRHSRMKAPIHYENLCEEGSKLWVKYTCALFSIGHTDNDLHYSLWDQHQKECEQCRRVMKGDV